MTERVELSNALGVSRPEKEFQVLPEVTPHQRLLGKIFGEEQEPISEERERELRNMLNERIAGLRKNYQTVLNLRLGLKGCPRKSLGQIAGPFGVTRERIRQIEFGGIRNIRRLLYHQRVGTPLKEYLSLPKGSVARQIAELPITTQGELKIFGNADLSEMGEVAPWVQYVLTRSDKEVRNLREVLAMDAGSFLDNLSSEQIDKLKSTFRQVYVKLQIRRDFGELSKERIKIAQPFGVGWTAEGEAKRIYKKNIFMPELPEGIVSKIQDVRLDALFLSKRPRSCLKRQGFVTIGDVLGNSERKLLLIRNFGVKSLEELQRVLTEYAASILQEKA